MILRNFKNLESLYFHVYHVHCSYIENNSKICIKRVNDPNFVSKTLSLDPYFKSSCGSGRDIDQIPFQTESDLITKTGSG